MIYVKLVLACSLSTSTTHLSIFNLILTNLESLADNTGPQFFGYMGIAAALVFCSKYFEQIWK